MHQRVRTRLNGFQLVVEPSVMHPRFFKSGMIFSNYLSTLDFRGKKILDMGTGSGILALSAAARGALVTASDINPLAVQCASDNFRRNGFDSEITTLEGDLFAPIIEKAYDIIVFNPPYFDESQHVYNDPALYGGKGLSLIKEFAGRASSFLKPGGYLLLIVSSDSNIGNFLNIFSERGFRPQLVHKEQRLFEAFHIYKITPSELINNSFICPSCSSRLALSQSGWECDDESLSFPMNSGVPDFILPNRRALIEQFLSAYTTIRSRESWGCSSRDEFLELPHAGRKSPHYERWKLRAKTFDLFMSELRRSGQSGPLRILDLGAGNCWFSHKLALLGHSVTAVDISIDDIDGLQTATTFLDGRLPFQVVRAEFDFLPFPEGSFDVIAFNASLHYSSDPQKTLHTAGRLLRKGGYMYILDSPFYRKESDGRQMMDELRDEFQRKYSVLLPEFSVGYLTRSHFVIISDQFSMRTSSVGSRFSSAGRRVIDRVLIGRNGAEFPLLTIQRLH